MKLKQFVFFWLLFAKSGVSLELPYGAQLHPNLRLLWKNEEIVKGVIAVDVVMSVASSLEMISLGKADNRIEALEIAADINKKSDESFALEVKNEMKLICDGIENVFLPKRKSLRLPPPESIVEREIFASIIPESPFETVPNIHILETKSVDGNDTVRFPQVKLNLLKESRIATEKGVQHEGTDIWELMKSMLFDLMELKEVLLEKSDSHYNFRLAVPYNCRPTEDLTKFTFRVLFPRTSPSEEILTAKPFKIRFQAQVDRDLGEARILQPGDFGSRTATVRKFYCDGMYSGPSQILFNDKKEDCMFTEIMTSDIDQESQNKSKCHTTKSLIELSHVDCSEIFREPECQVHSIDEESKAYIYCPGGEILYSSDPVRYPCPGYVFSVSSASFKLFRNSTLIFQRDISDFGYSWREASMEESSAFKDLSERSLQPTFRNSWGEEAFRRCRVERENKMYQKLYFYVSLLGSTIAVLIVAVIKLIFMNSQRRNALQAHAHISVAPAG